MKLNYILFQITNKDIKLIIFLRVKNYNINFCRLRGKLILITSLFIFSELAYSLSCQPISLKQFFILLYIPNY